MSSYSHYSSWQALLRDYDDAIATYAKVKSQTEESAKRLVSYDSGFWNVTRAKRFRDSGARKTEYFPFVEARMAEAIREALDWMAHPPSLLRVGLVKLANNETPKNFLAIVSLYGEFRAHLGVLQAPDFLGEAAYEQYRNSGSSPELRRFKTYSASYMQAHINESGGDEKAAIQAFGKHAQSIVVANEPVPFELIKNHFENVLQKARPRKMGQSEHDTRPLNMKKFRELFVVERGPKKTREFGWHIWVNDHLTFEIQEKMLRAPKKLKPSRFTF